MKVVLKDGAPRSTGSVEINVSKSGNTLEIGATGAEAPIVLEFYEGKLTLRVYGGGTGVGGTYKTSLPTVPSTPPVGKPDPNDRGQLDGHTHGQPAPAKAETAQEAVNKAFGYAEPADPTDDDLAAFDAA